MKKIYTTLFVLLFAVLAFAQVNRKASLSEYQSLMCKSCMPQPNAILDTVCNFESNDTLAIYYADRAPYDSGWATGHNAFLDKGWAERFAVSGNVNVIGGAYFLYEKSKTATSGGTATGKVYTTTGSGGKPGTSLGSANIPYSSMVLNGAGLTFFTFSSPVAVTNSFFMAFELGAYTFAGPDTIGLFTTKQGNRSTSNANQNCALFKDDTWAFELTENFRLKVNYQLCAIVDLGVGVNEYVSKGDLSLYAAYPNPSASDVTFKYSLMNPGKISIEIYDALGKSIMKRDKENQSAGMHYEKVDVSSFVEGNYFYKVSTEDGAVSSRFSIAK